MFKNKTKKLMKTYKHTKNFDFHEVSAQYAGEDNYIYNCLPGFRSKKRLSEVHSKADKDAHTCICQV